jgi:hypothetical protein
MPQSRVGSSSFRVKPWSLVHYVCLKSAIERIRPREIFFYCDQEPNGPWWDITRGLVTLEKMAAPREIWGNPLIHPAHRADVVRLEKLLTRGGIYLDVDVFVHKTFDDLLEHRAVLGEQLSLGRIRGLCNAVILAEPQSPFLARWHSSYRSFRSLGRDEHWDEHSVRMPYALSKLFPNEITTLPNSAFFWPTFTHEHLSLIFASGTPIDLSKTYATHLWENLAWDQYLEDLTPKRVRAEDTNFHHWVRPLIETLPDNYGSPTGTARFASGVRSLRRRVRAATRLRATRPQPAAV